MKTERRAVVRYSAKLPVEIEMGGYILDAVSIELSITGMRIACEGPIASNILNRYILVTPSENITANIHIKIPAARGLANTAHCRVKVISVHRVSQICYLVGLNIVEFEDDGQEIWAEHISKKS